MRLTTPQIQAIKHTARVVLGEGAQVTLFGSRVDDLGKGGDIDLLFASPSPVESQAKTIGQLYASLVQQLGEQKIDILLAAPNLLTQPIHTIAQQTGVQL